MSNKFAITGISRDASGYPVRLSRAKNKGCVGGKVQVEDRVLEGNFHEKDLKYISENEYRRLVDTERESKR